MEQLQIYKFSNIEIRTILIHDDPWFVLSDVCKALDIKNTTQVAQTLDDDERSMLNIGRQGDANCVNEQGLYEVIFQSKKKEAKEFRKWLKVEVLPSIRKHGAYMNEQVLEKALTSPDFLIKLATELKEEQEKRKLLEAQNSRLAVDNQIMQPKAEYFDELVDRNLLTGIRETAKELNVKEREFISFLLEKGYLYRDRRGKLIPYAQKNKGLFELKECFNDKTQWQGTQTLITPKGRETFRSLINGI